MLTQNKSAYDLSACNLACFSRLFFAPAFRRGEGMGSFYKRALARLLDMLKQQILRFSFFAKASREAALKRAGVQCCLQTLLQLYICQGE
ncbi:MAG: hypothetical protein NTX50_12995 [Candidatus Sumerlaeota bacterium]|nr:hypothetical protein [Candidatus Sumerlaeota bacterium]